MRKKSNFLKKHIKAIKIFALLLIIFYSLSLFVANIFYYKNDVKEIKLFPKISFGIDIVGGNQLTIAIDTSDALKDQISNNKEFIEEYCKDKKLNCKMEFKSNDILIDVLQNKDEVEKNKNNKKYFKQLKNERKMFIGQLRQAFQRYDLEVLKNDDLNYSILLKMTDKTLEGIIADITDKAISILKNRVDGVGVKEISVQRYGNDKIVILIPNGVDVNNIKSIINTTAKLNFHLMDRVHIFNYKPKEIAKKHVLYPSYKEDERTGTTTYYLMEEKSVLSGDCMANVQPNMDGIGVSINFRLNSKGTKKFGDITKNNIGRLLAIVLDEKVLMAPMINVPILGGSGSITGNFSVQEAQNLAVLLRSGSLPAKISIINERQLSSIFDKNVLSSATKSVLICMSLVALVLIMRYKNFGAIAFVALILNFLFTITIISSFGFTLTLPGIAGFVLMLGMATDANILIYEKMKELKKQGVQQPETIIKNSFSKAIATILDSNITTIIAGIALFGFGGSFIKGFSITLIFGILCSIFTSVNITKMIIEMIYKNSKRINI